MVNRQSSLLVLVIVLLGGCTSDRPAESEPSDSPVVNGPVRGPRSGRGPRTGPVPIPTPSDHDLKGIGKNMHEHVDPAAMTARVKNALATTKDLDETRINVTTDTQKTIHLTGSAKNEHEKAEAGKIAEAIAGREYRVSNELKPR